MDHKDYLVDILDESGRVVGQKTRRQVNKRVDRYQAVHVLMLTPQRELVLSLIPERLDLPNVYARRLGTPVATIRRSGDDARQAAVSAMERELFLSDADVHLLGEDMFNLPDGYHAYMSAFWVLGEPPARYSTMNIESLKLLSVPRFEAALRHNPEHFAGTLREIWERWGDQLPN